jgi:hypothetical protein
MVRMSMARLGSDNHTCHIICMRGCVVRHRKDWPSCLHRVNRVDLAAPAVSDRSMALYRRQYHLTDFGQNTLVKMRPEV